MGQYTDLEAIAQDYYNSDDADNFYKHIWGGGEDIHVGIYKTPGEDVCSASRRTVDLMVNSLPSINKDMRILDIGSGYGGPARYLAKSYQCKVDCLNISDHQNRINHETNINEGLSDLIEVTDGSFENIPYESNSFDVVWAQDCIVHSGNRGQVVKEVSRVLKPGGYFIFTDLMQAEKVPEEVLKPILARIHLDSMGTIQFYKDAAKEFGLSTVKVDDLSPHLTTHYTRVREELNANFDFLTQWCNKQYLVNMEEGLGHWIRAGENSHLCWGILLFQKTE